MRITFPLPLGIDHVHAYLVPTDDGGTMLVDTGLGLPGAEERWEKVFAETGPPDRIVITHFHPDHVGAAAIVAALSGAPVHQGTLDYTYCRRAWTGEATERSFDHLLEHGMPMDEAETVRAHQGQLTAFVHYAEDPEPLEPGDEIGGWRVLHLPGHADGHLALYRDGTLVAGDALLGGITPNVGLWPASNPNPLADYLGSLAQIAELDPDLALPGHGERILDPSGRALEIAEHHADRLERTLAAIGDEPRSGYDVCRTLFPDALAPSLRRFALAETLAHLEHLAFAERVTRLTDDGRTLYAAGAMTNVVIRPYADADERGWLECRVLAFLDSAYYDAVEREKEHYERPSVELVAEVDGLIVGLIDVECEEEPGTVCEDRPGLGGMIWHIAVLRDFRRQGIASRLLTAAEEAVRPRGIERFEAWTRDDPWVQRWYESQGFVQIYSYLHVYVQWDGARSTA